MVLRNDYETLRATMPSSLTVGDAEAATGTVRAGIVARVAARYAKALDNFAERLEGDLPDSEVKRHLAVIGELRNTWEQLLAAGKLH